MIKRAIRAMVPIKTFEQVLGEDPVYRKALELHNAELQKRPYRYDIINHLLQRKPGKPTYLEIGVRNPAMNFDRINCEKKYGVDPGIEFKENPVDFKMTSDAFFSKLSKGEILDPDTRFDVIFIDGLHLADQVLKDIHNAIKFLKENGFIVLHDCNPPTEYHAREDHNFVTSPARNIWNGTVWKAFYRMRFNTEVSSICIDTDWGVGIISKLKISDHLKEDYNPFLEYHIFNDRRKESLNLMTFEEFQTILNKATP